MTHINLPVPSASIPYFAEWTGVWSILPAAAAQLSQLVQRIDLVSHLAVQAAAAQSPGKVVNKLRTDYGPVAVLSVQGVLLKQAASIGDNTSTVMLRQEVRKIANDPSIGSLMLNIDSPGGSTGGLDQLANDIAALQCPVFAFASDLCCSAAYLLACCAQSITAERAATIGSIGTYSTVIDSSVAAAAAGVKVVNVTNTGGKFKGVGTPGTAITDEQLTMIKNMVNEVQTRFDERVSTGRKMPLAKAKTFSTGQVWSGTTAKAQGLIDSIGNFDAALAAATQAAKDFFANGRKPNAANQQMSETETLGHQVVVAQFNALVAEEQKQGCDLLQARRRVIVKHPALHRKFVESSTTLAQGVSGNVGGSVTSGAGGGRKEVLEYRAAIESTMRIHRCDEGRARQIVNREQPHLREAVAAIQT